MKSIRQQQPLAFALVAAVLCAVCFQVVPESAAWLLADAGVDPLLLYSLLQTLLAAVVATAGYFASGAFRLGVECEAQRGKQLSVRKIAAIVLLAALAAGFAKLLVQGGGIKTGAPAIAVFVGMIAATALFEELLFRGLLFEGFATMGTKNNALFAAAVASSLIFGILHITSDIGSLFRMTAYLQAAAKVAQALLFGLAMCALYVKTSSIWPCVLAHFGFDIVSELPIFLATGVQTSSYITGSPADLAIVAACALILALPAKWAADYLRR